MTKAWRLRLVNNPKETLTKTLREAWKLSLKDLEVWMANDFVKALVYGGFGIQGIAETAFYNFISSPEGLSQLGIESSEPQKLLDAYLSTFKVSSNNRMMLIKFGDVLRLKVRTPHPASGTGHLHVESWLEWITDGLKVGSGYVPRAKLPKSAHGAIRIRTAPGGLMLPRSKHGSSGKWQFPSKYKNYDVKWLKKNQKKIEKAIVNQMIVFINRRLK